MQDRFKYRNKNKFNLGDDVWVALFRFRILKANIKDISYYNNGEIKYFCHYYDGGIGFVSEENLFTTKEEAVAELDKRNKGGIMKVYIVIKDRYFEEYPESATEREILGVCQNKELAVKLQKEQILKFVPKGEIEKIKGEIENLNTKELKRIPFDYGNQGIGIEEYNIIENEN